MKPLFVIWLMLLFSGCSLPLQNVEMVTNSLGISDQSLQNIRIERWGKMRFSGILGVKRQGSGLAYVLLDTMGVKLLQGYADYSGKDLGTEVSGVLAEKGLTPFISKALARIYLQEPVSYPCASENVASLCVETGVLGDRVKQGKMLGMTYWTVHQVIEVDSTKNSTTIVAASYSQPLVGVKIFLQALESGG